MSSKQAINDKLQGSVATNLRCDGVVNNQIKKGLLLSLRAKKKLKSVNILQSYKTLPACGGPVCNGRVSFCPSVCPVDPPFDRYLPPAPERSSKHSSSFAFAAR